MAIAPLLNSPDKLTICWEPLPDDFVLPDEPVESNLQPLLAAALREALELAGLIPASCLIASNFGLCATVGGKTIVKAPDWVYVPTVNPLPTGVIRRSYTPNLQGDIPAVVMEFISETEGGEYSIKPYHPYGKWFFYEQILQVPVYVVFEPQVPELAVYTLQNGRYQPLTPDADGRYWLSALNLSLGVWHGQKSEMTASWLRWWDESGQLLFWGCEQIEQERQKAEQERLLAQQERQKAEQERQRAEVAEAQLRMLQERARSLGIDL